MLSFCCLMSFCSTWRTLFSLSCKAHLVEMNSLSFCLSPTFFFFIVYKKLTLFFYFILLLFFNLNFTKLTNSTILVSGVEVNDSSLTYLTHCSSKVPSLIPIPHLAHPPPRPLFKNDLLASILFIYRIPSLCLPNLDKF